MFCPCRAGKGVTVKTYEIFENAYCQATERGNSHVQAAAFAEWTLFVALAKKAPKGSYYAGRQAVHWLNEVARLEVRV